MNVPVAEPHVAVARLTSQLKAVETERVPLENALGRVLAESIVADRPSPAMDVSAMDGYAVRLADLERGTLPISAESTPGKPAVMLMPGTVMRVFTGAAVPIGAEAVVQRERTQETRDTVTFPSGFHMPAGQFIRRAGDNAVAGETVIFAGTQISAPVVAAATAFGYTQLAVQRRVRIAIIVTGDEVLPPGAQAEPWQLRDANGPALSALLRVPWADVAPVWYVADEPTALAGVLHEALATADAVLLTGGVSMGDFDFVPGAITAAGGTTVFHKLNQRPGKPLLGAVGPAGQLVLGLPGNPVSVLVTARRWGAIALRRRAGFATPELPSGQVVVEGDVGAPISLWHFRPVKLVAPGQAALVKSAGSGDSVSAARSDGFVEIPPGQSGPGPWPYFPWSLT